MGSTSFAGRTLFSAVFFFGIFWLKYVDEEFYLQKLEPVVGLLRSYMASLGVPVPLFQLKYLLSAAMVVQGLGATLFLFGSSLGAYLLLFLMVAGTSIGYDFYNHDISSPEYAEGLVHVLKDLAICGALLFFLGIKNQAALKSQKKVAKVKSV